jgi:hypothetical protein
MIAVGGLGAGVRGRRRHDPKSGGLDPTFFFDGQPYQSHPSYESEGEHGATETMLTDTFASLSVPA